MNKKELMDLKSIFNSFEAWSVRTRCSLILHESYFLFNNNNNNSWSNLSKIFFLFSFLIIYTTTEAKQSKGTTDKC